MRDPGPRAENAACELEQSVQGHEEPCRHRDRRDEQHHDAPRVQHAESEEHAEDTAGGADRRVGLSRGRHHDELDERGGDHGRPVELEIAPRAERVLDVAPDHVQREHVQEEMPDAAVQQRGREELPPVEPDDGVQLGNDEASNRPEREDRERGVAGEELRDECRDRDPDDDTGHRARPRHAALPGQRCHVTSTGTSSRSALAVTVPTRVSTAGSGGAPRRTPAEPTRQGARAACPSVAGRSLASFPTTLQTLGHSTRGALLPRGRPIVPKDRNRELGALSHARPREGIACPGP